MPIFPQTRYKSLKSLKITKGVIRSAKSKKVRQHKAKQTEKNNDLQKTTQKSQK